MVTKIFGGDFSIHFLTMIYKFSIKFHIEKLIRNINYVENKQ